MAKKNELNKLDMPTYTEKTVKVLNFAKDKYEPKELGTVEGNFRLLEVKDGVGVDEVQEIWSKIE